MDNPPEDGPCEVTITAPDREWLQALVRKLVQDRLAAAAHVDTMHTTYRWEGKVHEDEEFRATLHTMLGRVPDVIHRVHAEGHPYVVPCVVAKSLASGDNRYLDWIEANSS